MGGGYYSAPAVLVREGASKVWKLHYICRDYLGSITHVTDGSGSLVEELSYNAWGRLRDPRTHEIYAPGEEPDLFLGRGYTGHEHLAMFGLINMNARLYDPAVGRFLSPDPYVQAPDRSQNFNRYSYCLNNPLRYTDESGEYFGIDDLIAAVVGGVVNVVVNAVQGNIHSWGQGFSYFGVGASGTVAGMYGGPLAAGAVIGTGNSFVTQGFGDNGKWNWGNLNVDQIFMSGLMGAGTGYLGNQLSGFISPYASSLTSGLGGQAVQQGLTQGITGSATGFTLSAGLAWANGADFEEGLKQGGQGALTGFAIGTTTGVVNGLRTAHKAGENPWSGKSKIQTPAKYDYTPDPNGDNVTLYRGTTGSEGKGGPLFMTDNPEYAATFVKNGGQVVKVTIPRFTFKQMYFDRVIQSYSGNHGLSYGNEYMIKSSFVPHIIKLFKY